MAYDVLIVEDDTEMRIFLSLSLSAEGYTCLSAENGAVALNLIRKLSPREVPAIAVVDVSMPEMDGPHFVSIMEAERLAPNMEIFFFTGSLVLPRLKFYGKDCVVYRKPQDIGPLISRLNGLKGFLSSDAT